MICYHLSSFLCTKPDFSGLRGLFLIVIGFLVNSIFAYSLFLVLIIKGLPRNFLFFRTPTIDKEPIFFKKFSPSVANTKIYKKTVISPIQGEWPFFIYLLAIKVKLCNYFLSAIAACAGGVLGISFWQTADYCGFPQVNSKNYSPIYVKNRGLPKESP